MKTDQAVPESESGLVLGELIPVFTLLALGKVVGLQFNGGLICPRLEIRSMMLFIPELRSSENDLDRPTSKVEDAGRRRLEGE